MPTIITSERDDRIAALLPAAVMQHYGLHIDDRRLLYPFVLATVIVNELKFQARLEAEKVLGQSLDEYPSPEVTLKIDEYAALLLINVEIQGYEVFRGRVKGEFRGSNLEEHELHEAFDIIVHYARHPYEPLKFRFTSTEQQRTLAPLLRKLSVQ